jgi:pimeloyl-ACP methyl ester carboxylesterase
MSPGTSTGSPGAPSAARAGARAAAPAAAAAARRAAGLATRAATSPAARRGAWIGLVAGAVVAGVAAGRVAEHKVVRTRRQRPDPEAREPFGQRDGRTTSVVAGDGVPLHVEEVGDADAPLTVVFVHGFCVSLDCWYYQRRDLADLGRLVFYDQRSHGRSGTSDAGGATIETLGADLERVLAERVPTGPVMLVGHSMGGMTIMALADRRPDLFASRVVAVALLSTSAGKLATVTFGLPSLVGRAMRAVLPGVSLGVNRYPALAERGRRSGSDITYVMARRIGFGSPDVPPSIVELLEKMIAATPVQTVMAFLPTFLDHDKLAALDVLRPVPTLVLVGGADLMTPEEHSRGIAAALPDAELVVLPGAGHMVIMERPSAVNLYLRALAGRALVKAERPR